MATRKEYDGYDAATSITSNDLIKYKDGTSGKVYKITEANLSAQVQDDFVEAGGVKRGTYFSIVKADGTPAENGASLLAEYARVKALGLALDADTRYTLYIPAGQYDLTADLVVDTLYLDVRSLNGECSVYLTSNTIDITTQPVNVTGIDVGTQRFKIAESDLNTVITNCKGGDHSFTSYDGVTSGIFTNCTGGDYSFGGDGGEAGGTYKNCTGGNYSFAGNGGTASGTFTNCKGGELSFAGKGIASGTFTNCVGGNFSFGGDSGITSGTFLWCRLTSGIFSPTASGDFYNCVNADGSVVINTSLTLNNSSINEFSTDGTFAGNSDVAVPTEKAAKTYVDSKIFTTFNSDIDGQGYYLINSPTVSNLASQGAGYWFGGTNAEITLDTNPRWKIGSTIIIGIRSSDVSSLTNYIYGGGSGEYGSWYFDATHLCIGSSSNRFGIAKSNFIAGYNVVAATLSTDETIDAYLNGRLLTVASDYRANVSGISRIGSRGGANFYKGGLSMFLAFNKALSATEIKDLYSGATIPYKYEGASQTALTSGTLVVGKEYIIDTYVAGDDFTNVGGTNVTGTVFTATGTTPTTWTNSSSLRRQGCVLDLNPSGVGHAQWQDNSGNGLHGTVSGALPTALPSDHVERYYKSAMTGDTTLTSVVPAGYCLEYIVFQETAGNTATLDLGTSAGGNQVFINQAITASSITTVSINTVFSLSAATTLYLNDDDAGSSWNSGSVNATLVMRRVV